MSNRIDQAVARAKEQAVRKVYTMGRLVYITLRDAFLPVPPPREDRAALTVVEYLSGVHEEATQHLMSLEKNLELLRGADRESAKMLESDVRGAEEQVNALNDVIERLRALDAQLEVPE